MMERPGIDAELMMGMFAHERYGGSPAPGVSQILSTRGEPGMPPWVITTAPLPGHVEERRRPDGTIEHVIAPDEPLTPEQEAYAQFTTVFRRIQEFNAGNYAGAVAEQVDAKNLTRVLYPDDSTPQGKELRFRQQYFCVSASLQDMLAQHLTDGRGIEELENAYAIQLNDTHPALAIVELMRLLVDEYHIGWSGAWQMTRRICGYTNHTLLPEALETWPVAMFERVLPRHLQIVYQINRD